MAIEVIDDATPMLEALNENLPKEAVFAMFEGAQDIQQRAVEQAPVDKGNLEKAIQIDIGSINEGHIEVFINDDMVADGRPLGTKVGQYSEEMHERVYKPGKRSREKAAANGRTVGRKFLERAVQDLTPDVIKNINAHISRKVEHVGRGIADILNVLGSHRRRFTGGGVFNPRSHKTK